MKKFSLLALSSGLVLLLAVAACGNGGAGGSPTPPPDDSPSTAAPSGLAVTTENFINTLTWNAVSGTATYNLYWQNTKGVTKETANKISAVLPPFIHGVLESGKAYYYAVSAVTGEGETPLSDEVSAAIGLVADIDFADSALRTCARAAGEYLHEVTTLDCSSRNVTKLDGIEQLTALTTLYLQNNAIGDIAPLGDLTGLKEVYLASSQVSAGVRELLNLSSPRTISLSGNPAIPCADLTAVTNYFGSSVVDPFPVESGVNCAP